MTTSDTGNDRNQCSTREDEREKLRDFVAYTLTSARGLYREPLSYGPMRMVDALEKALALIASCGLSDPTMDATLGIIRENRWRAGTDPVGFAKALDDATVQLVRITVADEENS
ncbi:DUF6092 family protein [Alicyclobacillus dauci]|uniref:DUF6092 family protein n=1 Tax=Alicyclobacillus dauci TaxID=1475485 RepID=A0ABY6Z2K9_9BACL|nr:DUF6092 family protein [Alicyclobacillus dauci]WAH37110.1 DUF6092 family protein [Alicyclobacillus dauci]